MIFLREEPHQSRYPLDLDGFILSVVILLDAFYSLSALAKDGFNLIAGMEFLALIPLLGCFVWVENRQVHPLINLKFFRVKLFVQANLVQLLFLLRQKCKKSTFISSRFQSK